MTPEERAELLASEIGDTALGFPADIAAIAKAIREAIAAEREACARVAEIMYWCAGRHDIASAIRSRSKEGGEG